MTQHVMYHKFLSVPALVRGPQSYNHLFDNSIDLPHMKLKVSGPTMHSLPISPNAPFFPEFLWVQSSLSLWMAPPICPNQSHKWLPSWPHWLTRSFWFYVLNVYIQPPLSISLSNVIQVTLMWAPFQQLPTRCPICSYQLSNQFCG